MKVDLCFVRCLSPLHCGTGHSVDAIDLPIARDRASGVPILPGSSLKGALRAASGDNALTLATFGPDTKDAHEHAGGVQFGDARVLLFPARSLAGTFAYATSPLLLRWAARDAAAAGADAPAVPDLKGKCLVLKESALEVSLGGKMKVVFEDLDFEANSTQDVTAKWAGWLAEKAFAPDWHDFFKKRFAILPDDAMDHLLATATEVSARVRLDAEKKTVAKGALWWEESLPGETILSGVVCASGAKGKSAEELSGHVRGLSGTHKLGGKAGIGRGMCAVSIGEGN